MSPLLCALTLFHGCDFRPAPPILRPGLPAVSVASPIPTWKLVQIALQPGQASPVSPSDLIVQVDGPPGFARVSLKTAKAVSGSPPAAYLNDVLFPVGEQIRLVASLHPAERQAWVDVATQGEESTAILPTQDLGGRPWVFATELIAQPTVPIPEGREVPLGRWVCRDGADSWTLTLGVLLSREAVGPRLKPEGKPPR